VTKAFQNLQEVHCASFSTPAADIGQVVKLNGRIPELLALASGPRWEPQKRIDVPDMVHSDGFDAVQYLIQVELCHATADCKICCQNNLLDDPTSPEDLLG
jgi:hypothetical protein